MDILIAGTASVFFLPLMAVIWTSVRVTSRGPGLFWSARAGRGGRVFMMPKFRSMADGVAVVSREVLTSSEAARITPLGSFLRRTSLDELPQFWCVLRGQMSLVGPRALLPNDIATSQRAKFPLIQTIRPGITGLAQINGRNALQPRRKALYDRFYARKIGLALDLYIIPRTIHRVLLRRDIA